jgi:energy-converting hydrogenase Eha subunit A
MRRHKLLGAVIGVAFALGAIFAPIPTFLVWAWIHNLTPMGFVAEITEGEERRRWLLMLSVPFFVLPALVATGVFHSLANALFQVAELRWTSVFGAGDKPLLSFLPPESTDLNLFSAAVVAQTMHYVAVIVLLPQLLKAKQPDAPKTLVPWPSWPLFALGVAAVAAIAFGIYAVSYTDARAAYGVAAAIHAWIELPILLLALGQGVTSARE